MLGLLPVRGIRTAFTLCRHIRAVRSRCPDTIRFLFASRALITFGRARLLDVNLGLRFGFGQEGRDGQKQRQGYQPTQEESKRACEEALSGIEDAQLVRGLARDEIGFREEVAKVVLGESRVH